MLIGRDWPAVLYEHGVEQARGLDRDASRGVSAARTASTGGQPGGVGPAGPVRTADRRDRPGRLRECLRELLLGVGIGHDAAAGAEPDAPVGLERPDHHARIEPG